MKDRKRVILEAAARVIARRGVRGLRMEELAAEAHVSKALVYYHFGDRAGLLHHTLRFIGDRAQRYTRHRPPGSGEPDGSLRELERRLTQELQETPEVRENSTAWGELRAGAVFDPALREGLREASTEWLREIAELLGRVAQTAPDTALVAAAERLTVLLEGLSTRWLTGALPVAHARELMRVSVTAEVEGLRAARPRAVCPVG
ncbi:TetR/AcrR family transcriptional regulator [Streptomyces sp. NPDC056470]|uniref:TetR/AcrR family transcriptional regulator n=1 Tax=Streptomyces sp. NPDC056470 TaxID=3345831 RepID=UPI0036AA07C4